MESALLQDVKNVFFFYFTGETCEDETGMDTGLRFDDR